MDPIIARVFTVLAIAMIFSFLYVRKKIVDGVGGIENIRVNVLTIYIVSLVFPIKFPLIDFNLRKFPATYGDVISLGAWHVLIVSMLFFASKNIKVRTGNSLKWFAFFTLISALSYFNPNNRNPTASIVGIYYVCSWLVSSIIIYRRYNFDELLAAIWSSFKIIIVIELVFSILFPVLGVVGATSFFYGEKATIAADRMDRTGGASAIGTFLHPGPLSEVATFVLIFFASNFIRGIRKRESLLYMSFGAAVIVLAQARTSFIVVFLSLTFIYMIYKATSFGKIIRYSIGGFILVSFVGYLFIFQTEYGQKLFLSRSFRTSEYARLIHWYVGWETFTEVPLTGTGINAHLS
ncbi:MAG TPA: hypothetical protein VMM58_03125, partial [Bacteroidota bacterium]|nr:hypothetical protein [Bacteroidota bacterium]